MLPSRVKWTVLILSLLQDCSAMCCWLYYSYYNNRAHLRLTDQHIYIHGLLPVDLPINLVHESHSVHAMKYFTYIYHRCVPWPEVLLYSVYVSVLCVLSFVQTLFYLSYIPGLTSKIYLSESCADIEWLPLHVLQPPQSASFNRHLWKPSRGPTHILALL